MSDLSPSGETRPQLLPLDDHNRRLLERTHPADWQNPEPAPRYNLVVIGGGTAGLVAAAGAAGLGARVAIVERGLLGGDCLNFGCVPSKALLQSARAAAAVRNAHEFGVNIPGEPTVDFPAVMERLRRLRADLSQPDSAARFRELGVDVFLGQAKFTGHTTIAVAGQRLNFSKAVIATGARPATPDIPGLPPDEILTSETVFSLTTLPRRLAVIGAGPVGCELAQAFARLGAEVSLLIRSSDLLPREDEDAVACVRQALSQDGVGFHFQTRVMRADRQGEAWRLSLESAGRVSELTVDAVLAGVGRVPNVDGLGLEAAGVQYDFEQGVQVDDRLQTTNRRIYAAGDVCSRYRFTHAADFMARLVLQNALFSGRAKLSALTIPWCTYTSPEVAHVGISEYEAAATDLEIDTYQIDLRKVDRAVLDGQTLGFVKILTARGTDRILGATIVAEHAGETISELTLAMVGGIGLRRLGNVIHPYPTQAEAIRKLGDQCNRARLTPMVQRLLRLWLSWRR